jgi:delta14-sterol reductase
LAGTKSRYKSSSLKPHVSGNFIEDWWLGVQLNPHFMGVDLKFFFVRAGMMAWLFINLSLFAKSYLAGSVNLSVILYQFFCAVLDSTSFLIDHLLTHYL